MPHDVPLAAAPIVHRRADARRNRELILRAAERLIARHGIAGVSMDDVAAEAGVGKGTLYRRFGDRASLVRALVDDQEREFQERVIRGAPPLGPGASPTRRLEAFGETLLEFLERHGDFIAAAERGAPTGRTTTGVYAFHRVHVAVLLRQILGDDDAETGYLADVLCSALAAELFLHQRRRQGLALQDIQAGWRRLVAAVAGGASA